MRTVVIWLRDPDGGRIQEPAESVDSGAAPADGATRDAARATATAARVTALRALTGADRASIERAVGALGGRTTHSLASANALVATVPEEAVAALRSRPTVADVRPVHRLSPRLDVATAAMLLPAFWSQGLTGGSVDVAIVDSGTTPTHSAFVARQGAIQSQVFHAVASSDPDYADNASTGVDFAGHGTAVSGTLFSQGDGLFPSRLGAAHGMERFYNLKAAFNTPFGASLYDADAMAAVDAALAYADPPEVINMSYGTTASLDDDTFERYWDRIVDTFGTTVTLPAGNAFVLTPAIDSPALAYNVLAVANVDDLGTASRTDDVIYAGSARGPTPGGRKKPDIAAPGTAVSLPVRTGGWNAVTGTSLSGPLIAGAAALLIESGVTDARSVKAVLLNSADDLGAAGWDSAYGWGYVNGSQAYAQRSAVVLTDLAPNATRLFERASATTTKATAVWHRHASTALSNVDLRLYRRDDGATRSASTSGIDNVEQVVSAVAEGSVLALSASAPFAASERVALAHSGGFVGRAGPAPQITLSYPALVAPNATFAIVGTVRNTGDLRGHAFVASLTLPAGFSLVSGAASVAVGSLDAGATGQAVWNLKAPGADRPATAFAVSATTTSYGVTTSFASSASIGVATTDTDGDGLPDQWETDFGLDPASAVGANGANGDPDGDGRTNAQELAAGTHPRGTTTRYLAEGATGAFFRTRIALANPTSSVSRVLLRFLRSDGTTASRTLALGSLQRATVDADTVPGLEAAEFATIVEADSLVLVDRTMTWDASGYGSHADASVERPQLSWYFAEGATHSGFDLFYLLLNPNDTPAQVTVRFLRPSGAPLEKTYTIEPQRRFNIWVDMLDFPGLGAALANTDVGAVVQVTNNVPIIAERAMYLSTAAQPFRAGHESAGVNAPSTTWHFAEGATGPYFDMFLLLANPTADEAAVQASYLRPDGSTLVKTYIVSPGSRLNIWVDQESFGAEGQALADTAVATTFTSLNGVPVIAERAMWWPGPTSGTWQEAHDSPGQRAPASRWGLAEGEVGGPANAETYVLISNPTSIATTVRVTLLVEAGPTETRDFTVGAHSRFDVAVQDRFVGLAGKRFGAIVESSSAPIVVERSMYTDAAGVRWAAGTNALASPLP